VDDECYYRTTARVEMVLIRSRTSHIYLVDKIPHLAHGRREGLMDRNGLSSTDLSATEILPRRTAGICAKSKGCTTTGFQRSAICFRRTWTLGKSWVPR
jgi:hypothetical protein